MPITQLIIAAVIAIVLFIGGFLLGEWLHGLGSNLTDALAAAWQRIVDTFRPHGATPPGSIRASDGTLVIADGECRNGWSAYPDETTATRCITIDPEA